MLKVGYLGPEGTFSEEASAIYQKKIGKAKFIPYSTFHDLLLDADRGKIDEGIAPIENSVEGTIGIVTDTLVNEVDLKIKQEIVIPVNHYLMAKTKIIPGAITEVLSFPQVIDQCKHYLRKKLPKAKIRFSFSSADAARQVAEAEVIRGLEVPAAIASRASARLYGLTIIDSKINDYPHNSTRFVVLSKKDHARTGKDKTSIVFSILRDRPGGLHNVLAEFANRNINLTKIESRPTKKTLGDYFFFIDIHGHRTDKVVSQALYEVKNRSSFFKLLGSYPKAV
ncbi:MAG: prephenate dehydratase [bacterium]